MKIKYFSLLLCITFFLPVQAQMSQHLSDTLSAVFEEWASVLDLQGVAAAVVFPDGSLWTDAYGHYGTDTLTADLLYETGSITKSMTAATLLLMEEEGKLSLDDSIGQYLPAFPFVDTAITVRQLLNHTSGLHNYTANPNFLDWYKQNWNDSIQPDSILYRYIDLPAFAPGTDWAYSNSGYVLAGLIIEAIEQKPYHEVLRERLFDPHGLADIHTAFYDTHTKLHVGTWLRDGSYTHPSRSLLNGLWATASAIATPADLARWSHQFHGGRVLQGPSYQAMINTIDMGNGEGSGLGVFTVPYNGRVYLEHRGFTVQHSSMRYSVESDFSVVAMCINEAKALGAVRISNALIDLMESELPSVPTSAEELMAENDVRVYPNPATERIVIETPMPTPVEVSVYSISGALLLTTSDPFGKIEVNQDQMGSGLFLVTIRDQASGKLWHQRMVFQ